ncbi:hypothetical protein Q1695_005798 [Nippostrongylus brasiliensis]|nr:hypothetical protein Q1695_005798 [Nippostrongylus brasiliensis]
MFWSVFCVLLLVNVLVSNVEARCVNAGGDEYCEKFAASGGCDSTRACQVRIAFTKCERRCGYCKGFA